MYATSEGLHPPNKNFASLILFLLILILSQTSVLADVTLERIATSGMQAPDLAAGVTFSDFSSSVTIAPDGLVLFRAAINTPNAVSGLFTFRPESGLHLLALEGTSPPYGDGAATLSAIEPRAATTGGGALFSDLATYEQIFFVVPGSNTIVMPMLSSTPTVSPDGLTLAWTRGGLYSYTSTGVSVFTGGSLFQLLPVGGPAPSLDGSTIIAAQPVSAGYGGTVVIRATVADASGATSNTTYLARFQNGSVAINLLGREGALAAGFDGVQPIPISAQRLPHAQELRL